LSNFIVSGKRIAKNIDQFYRSFCGCDFPEKAKKNEQISETVQKWFFCFLGVMMMTTSIEN